MSYSMSCPPPLPARRSRNLALLIVGIVLACGLAAGVGLFGLFWLVRSSVTSNFSMDEYLCGKNIEEIALLKEEWSTAHNGQPGMVIPPADIAKILAEHDGKLICPKDPHHTPATSYEVGPLGTDPQCKCRALHAQGQGGGP